MLSCLEGIKFLWKLLTICPNHSAKWITTEVKWEGLILDMAYLERLKVSLLSNQRGTELCDRTDSSWYLGKPTANRYTNGKSTHCYARLSEQLNKVCLIQEHFTDCRSTNTPSISWKFTREVWGSPGSISKLLSSTWIIYGKSASKIFYKSFQITFKVTERSSSQVGYYLHQG